MNKTSARAEQALESLRFYMGWSVFNDADRETFKSVAALLLAQEESIKELEGANLRLIQEAVAALRYPTPADSEYQRANDAEGQVAYEQNRNALNVAMADAEISSLNARLEIAQGLLREYGAKCEFNLARCTIPLCVKTHTFLSPTPVPENK